MIKTVATRFSCIHPQLFALQPLSFLEQCRGLHTIFDRCLILASNKTSAVLDSNLRSPFFEQQRGRKFLPELKHDYKHKIRKPRNIPQYKYDFRVLEGVEYTHKPLKIPRLGGRHPETKVKMNQRVGGGYKFDWFWLDYDRARFSGSGTYEERVLEVRRCPNETAYCALVAGSHGRRWILATEGMQAGDLIRTHNFIPSTMLKEADMPVGDAWPVGALPNNTKVCDIACLPGAPNSRTFFRALAAGAFGTVLRQQGEYTIIKLDELREIAVKRECVAVIGTLSHKEHWDLHWGSFNMKRRWGIKQGSGFWHKKDQYCGRKGKHQKKVTFDGVTQSGPEPIEIPMGKMDHHAVIAVAPLHPVMCGG